MDRADLPTGTPAAPELLQGGSHWLLQGDLNGYSRPTGQGLATQARAGRGLRVLASPEPRGSRLRVRLLEDGYPCWVEPADLLGRATARGPWRARLLEAKAIEAATAGVMHFADQAQRISNHYLWGGSLGPNYDCSGFIQTAFERSGVWIPRDAYQQERFCQPVAVGPTVFSLLRPGDLIFFGTRQRCTHVGLHLGNGRYLHSSGRAHGRDGLGVDGLSPADTDPVASHYRRELRGAGRVVRCHDGSTLA
ncbi:C40 family peptidase [Cyanobium sp. Morenito 9A2]|uniref:C40 family peptidase n=1 Tax=Cyanobium sp. Morenito 9A2 TaxID=2823718 RepID=UPI0020CD9B36|nr:C40 family peptidase [Cyanobium sp. Morenito 9A2]